MQPSTLSEGVGGDMARDTYEMTSPMRVLSYGLGVAKYIPPTVPLELVRVKEAPRKKEALRKKQKECRLCVALEVLWMCLNLKEAVR